MQDAMEAAQEISANIFRSVQLGLSRSGHGRLGRPEIGVDLLQEAIGIVDNTDERFFEAELHRFRGEILIALGKPDDAEAALQRAMAVARIQDARLWELRAAASLRPVVESTREGKPMLAGCSLPCMIGSLRVSPRPT